MILLKAVFNIGQTLCRAGSALPWPVCIPSERRLSALAIACSCGIWATAPSFALAERLEVRVDPATAFQSIDGFGASDAWRCQFVGQNWPLEKRERIADLLFSCEADAQGNPQGIGLSIWRFNLGAGTAEQGDASGIENPWRRAECFQQADGSYDWTKQAGQQWFLRAARRRGVERFLAFPNSPPVHLTRNGKGYADKGPPRLNVRSDKLDDYARFMADVLERFAHERMPFDYLSPVNEPQWAWDGAGQEGTPALNEEICALVRQLSQELARRKLPTRIVIGEAGTIGHVAVDMSAFGLPSDGRDDQARYFFSEQSPCYLGDLPHVEKTISAHSYQSVWPLDQQVEYRQRVSSALHAVNPDLGYWQSEYCILERNDEIGGGGGRDLGMDTALYVARIIHHDLTLTHAKSWQWWTALSQVDFKDGLVYLDDGSQGDSGRMGPETLSLMHDGAVRESKLLWALGNYSRFVRPGMVRIKCEASPSQSFQDGVLASAYKSASGELVLVLVNLSAREAECDLGTEETVATYITSDSTNLRRTWQNAASVRIPARAVCTCVTKLDPARAEPAIETTNASPDRANADGAGDGRDLLVPGDARRRGGSPAVSGAWTSGTHTMTIDGLERTFVLDVPQQLQPGAALVFVFHGYTGSAEGIRNETGFASLAEQHGFVAVYPQGTRDARGNTFFHVGYAFHDDQKVDDVNFARQLADRLVDDLDLDPRAVFSTGMSNGGDMSFLLAAQSEPFVYAIAPVAGTMMASWSKGFVPRARTSVLAVHGTNDKVTLWSGDMQNREGWGAYLGVEAVADLWVRGLALETSETSGLPGGQENAVPCVRLRRWSTSADAAEFRLYERVGGGHVWPKDLGDENRSTAEEIWNFFHAQLQAPRSD